MTTEITIKLPDGSEKTLPAGSTGTDLAKSISSSLAKKSIGLEVKSKSGKDYELKDLFAELADGDEVKIICSGDKKSYEFLRHTTSHVMAESWRRSSY